MRDTDTRDMVMIDVAELELLRAESAELARVRAAAVAYYSGMNRGEWYSPIARRFADILFPGKRP